MLKKNRVGKALRTDPAVQLALENYRNHLAKFDTILPELTAAIAETKLYESFKRKRKLELADDVNFWTTIYATIIRKSKSVERVLRRDAQFSHVGLDAVSTCLSRPSILSMIPRQATCVPKTSLQPLFRRHIPSITHFYTCGAAHRPARTAARGGQEQVSAQAGGPLTQHALCRQPLCKGTARVHCA